MKRYIVSGSLILIMSMACEEKKKTVRKPVQPVPVPSEVTSSPEINLPTVASPSTEEPAIEAPKDKVSLEEKEKTPEALAKPLASETIALAAKTLPVPTVKYEDVTARDLAEGSANEVKDESLARIREKALQRAKELDAEQTKVVEDLPASAEGTKVAMVEPSEPATDSVDSEPLSSESPAAERPREEPLAIQQNIDKKTSKNLELRFAAAVEKVKAGRIELAKNEFLSICQSGHAHSCHKFAWYEERAGNHLNAMRFYRAACDNGLGKSCNNLAFQFEQKKNFEKALELYAKGCMDKHEASCQSLKRVREEQTFEGLKTR